VTSAREHPQTTNELPALQHREFARPEQLRPQGPGGTQSANRQTLELQVRSQNTQGRLGRQWGPRTPGAGCAGHLRHLGSQSQE
jgi:hypothetical protein